MPVVFPSLFFELPVFMMRTLLFLGLLAVMPFGFSQNLTTDERVIFLPVTAKVLDDGKVEARVDAWVFEHEHRPGLSKLLARYLDVDLDGITDSERERFYQRTQLFRVDSQNSMVLRIKLDGQEHGLPLTANGGRSRTRLTLETKVPDDRVSWLEYEVVLRGGDDRVFKGRTMVVPQHGLSVVSDIDDTIKYSNVLKKKLLLLNTFAREFHVAPCMAERYQQIAATAHAPAFHYLSSSPIQLYPPLAEFLVAGGFPEGSVHLRESTSMGNVVPEEGESQAHKLDTLRMLLADFPDRKFLLIGDSGELDPEIYATIAREFPRRIVAIRIRDVTGDPRESERYERAFAKVAPELWSLFSDTPRWQPFGPPGAPGEVVSVPAQLPAPDCLAP